MNMTHVSCVQTNPVFACTDDPDLACTDDPSTHIYQFYYVYLWLFFQTQQKKVSQSDVTKHQHVITWQATKQHHVMSHTSQFFFHSQFVLALFEDSLGCLAGWRFEPIQCQVSMLKPPLLDNPLGPRNWMAIKNSVSPPYELTVLVPPN